jgi:hypothetical protein
MYSNSLSAHGLWLSKLSHIQPLMKQALDSTPSPPGRASAGTGVRAASEGAAGTGY